MDLLNWVEYLKMDNGCPSRTNMVYIPLMNEDRSILCMDFGNKEITFDNTFFFNRELDYLERFKNYSWSPKVLEVDRKHKRVFIKWIGVTCNNLLYDNLLDDHCEDWRKQLCSIIKDILEQNVYKLTLYPHCFYVDETLSLKTFDFYACVDKGNSLLPTKLIENIIGEQSIDRWKESIIGDTVDFELFFNRAVEYHVTWNNELLGEIINGL